MLRAIEDILQGRMQDDYVSYTIGNHNITKMSPESLIKLRDYFQDLVNQEEQYNVNGINKGNKIKIRWVEDLINSKLYKNKDIHYKIKRIKEKSWLLNKIKQIIKMKK